MDLYIYLTIYPDTRRLIDTGLIQPDFAIYTSQVQEDHWQLVRLAPVTSESFDKMVQVD